MSHWIRDRFLAKVPSGAVNRLMSEVLDLLFPRKCMRCGICFRSGKVTAAPSIPPVNVGSDYGFYRRMTPFFCPSCRSGFNPADEPLCTVCGVVFKSREGVSHICAMCERNPRYYNKARALGIYEGPLLWAIRKFKYHGEAELAEPLGRMLWEAWRRWWPDDPMEIVLPVPLHPKKMRQRGFNQSYLLIQNWKDIRSSHQPLHGIGPVVEKNVLVRTRHTKPQASLSLSERRRNLREAFKVTDPDRIRNRHLLLVDDVMTSGGTVESCARTLIKAGARRVDVLTLARAL